MTDEEKRELLKTLDCLPPLTDEEEKHIAKLRALINTPPPPKHTQCENCLDDLEDYVWVYCDKCWQKLLAENTELKVMVAKLEAGVEINPDNNRVKVSGQESPGKRE